ncbi:hypothetical protein TSTA_054320 [Talaromyces stipitatus ATCC 10500]|uniref:DUF7730 domain-containing protein n=1 Tax=Talaromyces stipitatus (strain ATCC 10500 / CBS 375.48 / QM 6759 / NRRL 1006) TaxID=441959 RepID=B8MR26_TALSN|nr:uncharacterized protein TSTA_054320 [Talaromyces stipitatus ATCC 10500]EED12921.1 hypothetical protein TSTA_054320 [Talaromyces stipitatus ATCC 10500]
MDSEHQIQKFQALSLQRRATPANFLDLPYELRLQIYSYCIPQGYIVETAGNFIDRNTNAIKTKFAFNPRENQEIPKLQISQTNTLNPSLPRVCKQISEECLQILYGNNQFSVRIVPGGGESDMRDVMTEQNMMRIRHVKATAGLWPGYMTQTFFPFLDDEFWEAMTPHLKSFVLEANEPGTTCLDWITASPEVGGGRLAHRWDLFGRLLADFCDDVEIDISVGWETLPLARGYFPAPIVVKEMNKVQCVCGRGCTDYY